MLNKKEKNDIVEFVTMVTETARDLLDNIADFETILEENEREQKRQSAKRKERARRYMRRRKLA